MDLQEKPVWTAEDALTLLGYDTQWRREVRTEVETSCIEEMRQIHPRLHLAEEILSPQLLSSLHRSTDYLLVPRGDPLRMTLERLLNVDDDAGLIVQGNRLHPLCSRMDVAAVEHPNVTREVERE